MAGFSGKVAIFVSMNTNTGSDAPRPPESLSPLRTTYVHIYIMHAPILLLIGIEDTSMYIQDSIKTQDHFNIAEFAVMYIPCELAVTSWSKSNREVCSVCVLVLK